MAVFPREIHILLIKFMFFSEGKPWFSEEESSLLTVANMQRAHHEEVKTTHFQRGNPHFHSETEHFSEGNRPLEVGLGPGIGPVSEEKDREKAQFPSGILIVSRKEIMGTYMEFAKILEKKIRKEIEQDLHASPTRTSNSTAQHTEIQSELWTHLVGHLDARRFENQARGQVYHRNRPAPRPRPDHKLNESQSAAHAFFERHGAALAMNFSSQDLQKAFRQLALKLHPDQGGQAWQIQKLLEARTSLLALFTKA